MGSFQAWHFQSFNFLTDSNKKRLVVTEELAVADGCVKCVTQKTVSTTPTTCPNHDGCKPYGLGSMLFSLSFVHTDLSPKVYYTESNWEMLAVIKVCQAFKKPIKCKMLQVATDKTSTIHYVNKQSGTHSMSLL